MTTHCTTCGHPVPEGQFRCGRCGAPQDGDEVEDELLAEVEPPAGADSATGPQNPSSSEPPADDGAVSLPPPPGEEEEPELQAASSDSQTERTARSESAPPGPDEREREDDTERRKSVPKGAFGEGSVVDKLPEGEQEPARHDEEGAAARAPAPSEREQTGRVARLPGLEPTRHREDAEEEATGAPEASPEAARDEEEVAAAEAEPEPDLELDVPTGGIRALPHKPRPPHLASEIMRQEIVPERPGAHRVARFAQGCGVAAVASYGLVALARPDASIWGLPALLLLALGVLRLGYVTRASSLALLTVACLSAAAAKGATAAPAWYGAAAPWVVLWLSASLLLRCWYRGHRQPPWMVAVGVVAATVLGLSALQDAGPWALTGAWVSWLPALVAFAYVQLCLLSMLAFMGPETTAAGSTWAICWWIWHGAAHLVVALGQRARGRHVDWQVLADAATETGWVQVLVVPVGAFALAQLYAVALSRREPEATDDPHVEAAAAE